MFLVSKSRQSPPHTRYREGALKCILMKGVEFKGAVQAKNEDAAVYKRKAIPSTSISGVN